MTTAADITARDIGLAIRDFIEGQSFSHFDDDRENGGADIVMVDVSDARQLRVVIEDDAGQMRAFVVYIADGSPPRPLGETENVGSTVTYPNALPLDQLLNDRRGA